MTGAGAPLPAGSDAVITKVLQPLLGGAISFTRPDPRLPRSSPCSGVIHVAVGAASTQSVNFGSIGRRPSAQLPSGGVWWWDETSLSVAIPSSGLLKNEQSSWRVPRSYAN